MTSDVIGAAEISDQGGEWRLDQQMGEDLAAAALTLARRFSAGGTLWCVSPAWAPHANHVAVEFVHPVVVGKRALPAVALTGPDPISLARVSVRPGDVILAIAGAAEPTVGSLMRRAQAWGATTIWIGNGARPAGGAADYVLWIDDPDPRLPATGRFVLLYHLLWELTHVCFEHPGLLTVPDEACADDVCITCSDEGRLGEVVAPRPDLDGHVLVRTSGGEELVNTMLVDPVRSGDLILIHAGSAIAKVEEGDRR